jgi:hypothetical protein
MRAIIGEAKVCKLPIAINMRQIEHFDFRQNFAFRFEASSEWTRRALPTVRSLRWWMKARSLLKAGDVLIQRGTNHAWSNRTDEPAYVAFVLIDTEMVSKSG